jgi:hypothetical protein
MEEISVGSGLSLGSLALGLDLSAPGADPALAADAGRFQPSGLVFEGATADTIETRIAITDPTVTDKTFTIPNADSNPVQPLTCGGTDKVSAISSTGVITCSADAGGAGAGTPVAVNGSSSASINFNATTPAAPANTENVNFQLQAGSPDQASAYVLRTKNIIGAVVTSTATGTQNDFSPTNWDAAEPNKATVIEWNGTAPMLLTSLAGGTAGRVAIIRNNSTEQVIVFQSNGGGTAANRFKLAIDNRAHYLLLPGDTITLVYNGTSSRWEGDGDIPDYMKPGWGRIAQVPGTGTTPISLGIAHTTASGGTISTPTIATTNYRNSMRRTQCVTGATAGTICGTRHALQTVWRGNAAGLGGFFVRYQWAFNLLPASADTWFVGLFASTAVPTNQDMSANLNMIGWGRDPADTAQVRSVGNDGTGAGTKVDLGANFPVNTTAVYEGIMFAIPNGTGVTKVLWRKDDMTIAPDVRFDSTAADLPTNTSLLAHYVYQGNRAAAVSYGMDWGTIEEMKPY